MFDDRAIDRLGKWKEFRAALEDSNSPLEDVTLLWSKAPFVSDYLDPNSPEDWPDPWHLILDNRLDGLAISLGMLYTLKLTQRFMDTPCEIHKSVSEGDSRYFLLVDKRYLLNYKYREVVSVEDLEGGFKPNLIYPKQTSL